MNKSNFLLLVGMLLLLLVVLLSGSSSRVGYAEEGSQNFLLVNSTALVSNPLDNPFGPFGSCMQIMPGDNNSPEPPGSGGTDVDAIISLHQEMGFQWDRTNIAWGSVEHPQGNYHWEEVDKRLKRIMDDGIQPTLIAYGGNNYDGTIYWDDHMPGHDGLMGTQDDYLQWVKLVVERYDGDGVQDAAFIDANHNVKYWEGWNEPVQFAGVSVQQSTELHQKFYAAVKEVCPDCFVISPGFAYMDRHEEFLQIDGAHSFDMLSVHSNYYTKPDPDDSMLIAISRQDRDFQDWGLGDRPWWISEFGPISSTGHTHAFRSARMYIVAHHAMFHTNLIAATQWPKEGSGNELIDWGDWALKETGQATKILLSIFQDSQIIQSERFEGENYRIYSFTREDGSKKYAIWALEDKGNPQITLEVNAQQLRITDMYGEKVEIREVSNGRLELNLSHEPVYIEEMVQPEPIASFEDVPEEHPYFLYIEALYREGYVAGCNSEPLMYCPEDAMKRSESAVFVERGAYGAEYDPPDPEEVLFADVTLDAWYADWVHGLWDDGFTDGCGKDPLVYCPDREHTRAEGCVFYLRMMYGVDYEPSSPRGYFRDVNEDMWYADWVDAAWDAGIIEPCATEPELLFCPEDPLTRAVGAYMMFQAKGWSIP